MRISVIVAAYNIEKYIERCLKSIIGQTLKDIEIIVVNDGSKDSTLEIINDISKQHNNIIVINKKNEGLIEARKSGLKVAKGDYVLFVDGDDWLEVDCLEKLNNMCVKENSDVIMYNAFEAYDNRKYKQKTFNGDNCGMKDYLNEFLIGNISCVIWAKLIKRDFILSNNIKLPTNISYGEDIATVASILMYEPKISFLDEHLYNYYQRDNSITHVNNNKILEIFDVLSFIKEELERNNLYIKYKEQFEYLCFNHSYFKRLYDISDFNSNYRYVHKEIYLNSKNLNIDMKNNLYIKRKGSLSCKVRISLYKYNYYLGRQYDFFRRVGKRIVKN